MVPLGAGLNEASMAQCGESQGGVELRARKLSAAYVAERCKTL
jgi:hypothetical protein